MYLKIAILFVSMCLMSTAYALPDIRTWTTDHGLRVLFVESAELPMVDLALTFDAGSARDADLAGLSVVMHSLLDKGTGDMDADGVASRFEDVGAQYAASVDLDRSSITLRSLSDDELFSEALETFIAVLAKPTFPERDFVRE